MFKAIEAIYEDGKLKFLEKVSNIRKARVMVIFLDRKGEEVLNETRVAELPQIELPKESIEKYERQLKLADKKTENREIDLLTDPFFSLRPIDMGYTNARMLDTIIASEAMKGTK